MKHKNDLKIAIIGVGPAGLACALECERLGVIPDVFERSDSPGWLWPSQIILINAFETTMGGDIRKYLKDIYNVDIQPSASCKKLLGLKFTTRSFLLIIIKLWAFCVKIAELKKHCSNMLTTMLE